MPEGTRLGKYTQTVQCSLVEGLRNLPFQEVRDRVRIRVRVRTEVRVGTGVRGQH